jgi:hypothetical protein
MPDIRSITESIKDRLDGLPRGDEKDRLFRVLDALDPPATTTVREYKPVPPEGAPTLQRKRYLQRASAARAATWLNNFGESAKHYTWSVRAHPNGGYELWKVPKSQARLRESREERDERLRLLAGRRQLPTYWRGRWWDR